MSKNRILIIGDKSRFIHLENFLTELSKLNFETKLIYDLDYLEKFEKKISFKKNNKKLNFLTVIKNFKPDVILLDRLTSICDILIDEKLSYWILLRGNIWEEFKWKQKTDRRNIIRLKFKEKKINYYFKKSELILPISNYLYNETHKRFSSKKIILFRADGRNVDLWQPLEGLKLKHPCVGLIQGFNIWGKSKELLQLENIMKNLPNVNFYLAGDGIYRDKIITKLNKSPNFFWLQNVDYPLDIIKFFSEIDIFLHLSGLEGLGQTVIESLLMKKPTISSNIGGIPELISHEKNGFLIDNGNNSSVIEYIEKILNQPKLKKLITESEYEKIRTEYSWKSIAKRFEEILNSNLAKN